MKITTIICVLLMLLVLNGYAQTKVIYTCPMHPEVQMSRPGNCPKCGMTLVKKTVKIAAPKQTPPKKKVQEPPVKTEPVTKDQDHNHGQPEEKKQEIPKPDPVFVEEAKKEIGSTVNISAGRTVVYHLYVSDTIVNFTGKPKRAIAINGKIPAPTLTFTEGDTAAVYLHNNLKNEETSLHWHGIILPNKFDGVPYLTTAKIPPGSVHLYKFRVVQNGTYWYHSHSKLQEQAGMYGALIFKKRDTSSVLNKLKEYNLVLSEWTDEKPSEVQRRLRTGNDWYAIKKGSTQSYSEALKDGYLKTKFVNEWKRMKAMDVSDVYYDRFLSNGKQEMQANGFSAGDKVRIRVVNAGASTYFWLQYAGGKMTVVANDGNDVVPVEVDRLIIGVAETYDVEVTIPANMSYELRATPEDRTKYTSLWLGTGMKMKAPSLPRLKYFEGMKMMNDMMKTNGDMKQMGMQMSNQTMDMNVVMYPEITGNGKEMDSAMQNMNADIVTLNYGMLRSPVITTLPVTNTKQLTFTLTGNMNRYVWSINNKVVNEWDKILIRKGENVKIYLFNNSMMRHPMHLHGHDFRVLNGQGDYSPLKNVLDIMPMETDSIEFAASQDGDWFFHCHILYHMMAGMGNVFSYINSSPNPELPSPQKAWRAFKKDNHMIHFMIKAGLESNGSDGETMLSGNRYSLQGMWHMGLNAHHGYEAELNLGRYIGRNQWLFPYIGFDYHYRMQEHIEKNLFGQESNKNNRKTFVAGIQYTLPWLLIADARVDGNGKFRLQFEREDIPLTPRMRLSGEWNTDKEYAIRLRYIISKWFAISTHYDSDMGRGAGITISY